MVAPIEYPDPPLAGAGFVLRPFRASDFASAHAASEHPTTVRWINPLTSPSGASAVEYFESERLAGRMLDLVIADDIDDRYLGEVVLLPRDSLTFELAYIVAPDARGRGLATAAVRLVSAWAVRHLIAQRLQVRVDPDNDASLAVAEKAGFRREGVLRSAIVVRGSRSDAVMLSFLPDDPEPDQ
jgi:RimJ/RimL family protein N-acetyltransferase